MSHSSEKFCNGFLLFFGKFLVSKSFMDEKARITFLLLKFLVSQRREISWASPQCFRQIGILKNSMHTRGYHVFASKLFGLTVPQNFVGIPSIFQKSWGIGNFYALMGYHNFLSKSCVSQCRKLLWASLQCFRNLGYRKILCNMGVSQFFVEIFLSHSAEKFSGHPFNVSENLRYRKILCIIGGITIFPSKNFCLTVPKIFVRETYCFWENFCFQKVLEMRKRVSRFSVEIFWSHSTEIFCDYPLNLLENLGYRKLFMHNRGYHNFPSKYFCLTVPKKFVGIPSMFQNNWDIEKLYAY